MIFLGLVRDLRENWVFVNIGFVSYTISIGFVSYTINIRANIELN